MLLFTIILTYFGLFQLASAVPLGQDGDDQDITKSEQEAYNLALVRRDLISNIGNIMGLALSFGPSLGIDTKGDMTSILCKTFNNKDLISLVVGTLFGSPIGKEPGEECVKDTSGGSGAFKAKIVEDPSLPNHTIYVPEKATNEKLPVIAWANGFCLPAGTMFANFLSEIASHGYMVIANGPINHDGKLSSTTRVGEITKSIDWVTSSPEVKKYGNIDTSNIVAAGQSCGGLNAMAAGNDARIKLIAVFNSADFDQSQSEMLSQLKTPIAFFQGGPKDFADTLGQWDYRKINNAPALYSSVDIGHIGTYYQKYGGKMGKVAVAFFNWKLKGDAKVKNEFCGNAPDTLMSKLGFNLHFKNGMC